MQPITTQKQTTGSKSNPLDDSFTRPSPCKGTPREFKSKDVCIETCLRMEAYKHNQPFDHLPCVEVPETYKKYDECLIHGCEKDGDIRGLCSSNHYGRWCKGLILHPVLGKWERAKKRASYKRKYITQREQNDTP